MVEQRKIAILDANLLLLAVSASIGFDRLKSFSRIQMFVKSDILLLQNELNKYSTVATTSYVLAEVSNLANKLSGSLRKDWYEALAYYAVATKELHVPTGIVGSLDEVTQFGITDAALRKLAETHMIITLEWRLSGYLEKLKLNVTNFNHLRSL